MSVNKIDVEKKRAEEIVRYDRNILPRQSRRE